MLAIKNETQRGGGLLIRVFFRVAYFESGWNAWDTVPVHRQTFPIFAHNPSELAHEIVDDAFLVSPI